MRASRSLQQSASAARLDLRDENDHGRESARQGCMPELHLQTGNHHPARSPGLSNMSARTRHFHSSAIYARPARGGLRDQTREPPEWLYRRGVLSPKWAGLLPKIPTPREKYLSARSSRRFSRKFGLQNRLRVCVRLKPKSKSVKRASTLFKRRYVVFAPAMLNLGHLRSRRNWFS